MKKLKLVTLSIILGFFSCTKIDDNGFKVYKIKKNKHRSTFKIQHTKNLMNLLYIPLKIL